MTSETQTRLTRYLRRGMTSRERNLVNGARVEAAQLARYYNLPAVEITLRLRTGNGWTIRYEQGQMRHSRLVSRAWLRQPR